MRRMNYSAVQLVRHLIISLDIALFIYISSTTQKHSSIHFSNRDCRSLGIGSEAYLLAASQVATRPFVAAHVDGVGNEIKNGAYGRHAMRGARRARITPKRVARNRPLPMLHTYYIIVAPQQSIC